ncbi:hotdog fold thioesterase [Spelaeicoccus albus]
MYEAPGEFDADAVLAHLNERSVGTLSDRMGIEFIEAAPDRLVATMPVEGNTQPYGLLHGGAHVVLAETLGSMAASVAAGPGKHVVGIELNASHSRGVRSGRVTGTVTPVHVGGTLMTHRVEVRDEDGKLASTIRITNLVRDAAGPGH